MTNRIWAFSVALAYALIETAYFGWNWTAQSDAEMLADGIASVLFVLALITPKEPK